MSTARAARFLTPLLALLMGAMAGDPGPGPAYDAAGGFVPPGDYREWIYVSTGLDMSYSEDPALQGHSTFDNVFVDPASWAAFKRSGHWPDKTMFAMENRGATSHGSINKSGMYQTTEFMGVEYHVRDEARFKGGWGFFAAETPGPAKQLPYSASCYACHQAHGAVDTTFTQFYPTAKPIAVKAGTYREP